MSVELCRAAEMEECHRAWQQKLRSPQGGGCEHGTSRGRGG